MIDFALVVLAFIATVFGALGETVTKSEDGKVRIKKLGIATICVALAIASAAIYKIHTDQEKEKDLLLRLQQSELREKEAQQNLRNVERIVFVETIRFGGGNPLNWKGPTRIPGGSIIEISDFDVELYVYIGGREPISVKNSRGVPQFIRVPGTPGEVAYEWEIGILKAEDREKRRLFEEGTVKVRSTFKLGEWSHTRDPSGD